MAETPEIEWSEHDTPRTVKPIPVLKARQQSAGRAENIDET